MAPKASRAPATTATRGGARTAPVATAAALLHPLHDRDAREAIFDAVASLEVSQTDAWGDLDALSSHTQVDSVDLVPEGIFVTGDNGFAAAATVCVELQYGGKNDSIASADAFPAEVRGHFKDDGSAVVDDFKVDTSSYYA